MSDEPTKEELERVERAIAAAKEIRPIAELEYYKRRTSELLESLNRSHEQKYALTLELNRVRKELIGLRRAMSRLIKGIDL